MIRALLQKLFAMLRPVRAQQIPGRVSHHPVSSYTRRYPGRTPASELRRNLGWIAVTADRSHRDRRA